MTINWYDWKQGIGPGKIPAYHRKGEWVADKEEYGHLRGQELPTLHLNDLRTQYEDDARHHFGEKYEIRVGTTHTTLRVQYRRLDIKKEDL